MVCPYGIGVGAELTGYSFRVFVAEKLEALTALCFLDAFPGIRPQMQFAGVAGSVTGLAEVLTHGSDARFDGRSVDLDAGPVREPT